MPVFLDLNEVSPAVFGRAHIGRTTEGTLGRVSSTVANRARRSVGGGVLINIIKLAALLNASTVPQPSTRPLLFKYPGSTDRNYHYSRQLANSGVRSAYAILSSTLSMQASNSYTIWNIAPFDAANHWLPGCSHRSPVPMPQKFSPAGSHRVPDRSCRAGYERRSACYPKTAPSSMN